MSHLIIPDHIAELAEHAKAMHDYPKFVAGSEEEVCGVIADWYEEAGAPKGDVEVLRPPPPGMVLVLNWEKRRRWVLNALIEGHHKRDAIAEMLRRTTEGHVGMRTGETTTIDAEGPEE